MYKIIGTCSICGGRVTVPHIWGGVTPPTPTCDHCGATAAAHGPVIPMQSAERTKIVPGGWNHLRTITGPKPEEQ